MEQLLTFEVTLSNCSCVLSKLIDSLNSIKLLPLDLEKVVSKY